MLFLLFFPMNHFMTPLIHLVTLWRGPDLRHGDHWHTVCLCVAAPEMNYDSCCVCGSAAQSGQQNLVECEVASVINSLPLCCIFVRPESLVLMISAAAFVHLSQTKARVSQLVVAHTGNMQPTPSPQRKQSMLPAPRGYQ